MTKIRFSDEWGVVISHVEANHYAKTALLAAIFFRLWSDINTTKDKDSIKNDKA